MSASPEDRPVTAISPRVDEREAPAAATMVVGAYLRSLRRARGMTLHEAAWVIRGSAAKISRLETCLSPQRASDVRGLLSHYEIGLPAIRATCEMAHAPRRDQWADSAPGWPARLAACSQEASAVRVFTMYLIPDILQIPAYASLIPDPEGFRADARALPPGQADITLLLDESVLRRPFGAPVVVAAQIAHLQERAAAGDVRVLVVPLAAGIFASSGLLAELTLYGHELYADESGMAVYSTGGQGLVRRGILDAALAAAVSAEQSAEMLEEARVRFEQLAERLAT